MSIQYALLGLLSWRSATGYELKKIIEESSTMYWSGNNNQIYKSLVQMLDEGLVTNEIQHQESTPSKKIYSITEKGLASLREWVLSEPETPEFKNIFLVQLAWADQLSNEELNELFIQYESRISMQLAFQQEKIRRGIPSPHRNERETFLWDKISENLLSFYQNELKWVQKIRKDLSERKQIEERTMMNFKINENGTKKYIEVIFAESPFSTEEDAVNLVALCKENESNLLLLHSQAISEDFFKLRTGVAGQMIQKWINYHVKTAAVIPKEMVNQGRFKEMALESKKSNHFRMFETRDDAENWLLHE
ncbi:DUF4180 domain-containing protein [Paenibacillus silvae]|jgi:DNA-binding PadR family transcriptional regulator|uniref:DUF4180 domain-containing protein n=1 Tax=Paenibacillus silvae TaxID=1325358 RepID=UPI0025A2A7B7|nr:DUF4180 domain-containing protein [Paenibacillus silvae]MDM5277511.1 DUF4180 domain-containing protein [Paenibacillus silvae]